MRTRHVLRASGSKNGNNRTARKTSRGRIYMVKGKGPGGIYWMLSSRSQEEERCVVD